MSVADWADWAGWIGLTYTTFVVLLAGTLLGANSGLVGGLALLKGRSLVSDALGHAALPGVCLGFLWAGHRSLPALLIGALTTGWLAVGCISLLTRVPRIRADAAIGVVLTVFFAVGLILSRYVQTLSGVAGKAGLPSFIFGKASGMLWEDVVAVTVLSFVSLVTIIMVYKELKLTLFDPKFGQAQGWPVLALDIALMTLMALTVVVGLPAVGVVLMAALLIIPSASARFWTDRLGYFLIVSTLMGATTGAAGVLISTLAPRLPTGPLIVVVGASLFLISLTFAPQRGLLSQYRQRRALQRLWSRRRALCRLLEFENNSSSVQQRRPLNLGEPSVLNRLRRKGFIESPTPGHWKLTNSGRQEAHRYYVDQEIWKTILQDQPELATTLVDPLVLPLIDQLPDEELERFQQQLQQTS